MKKNLSLIAAIAAILTLTACGKTENISAELPTERSMPIAESAPQDIQSAPEISFSFDPYGGETIEPPKLGELVGPEDFPSRGRAACIATKTTIYLKDESLNSSEIEVFDEHGNCLYQERSYGDPKIKSYEYDERGNIAREYFEANYYCDYEYNEDGRVVSFKACKNGNPAYMGTQIFDEHGELLEAHTDYYWNGSKQTVNYYDNKYDENGRLIASTWYGSDHVSVREENSYEYDGEILKRRVSTTSVTDGKTSWEYEYDADGNIVNHRIIFYDQEGAVKSTSHEERSYNADGKIVQNLIYDKDGELETKELYEYQYAN